MTFGHTPYGAEDEAIGTLSADVQGMSPSAVVVLFDIDTAPIGGTDIWYLCPGTVDGQMPSWRGHTYTPFPIMVSGFEWTGRGALPRPKMTVANALGLLQGAVVQYDDLLGAKVTRWKTLKKYLDGQPEANSEVYFTPDVYYIDRKSAQTKEMIEFELAALLDQQGKLLPARQILRDACPFSYRRWSTTLNAFVYDTSANACPYSGGGMYNLNNDPTTDPRLDKCSKSLTGCRQRFGWNAELPFGGFPSVSRVR
jgi:lambda family phage minor tail protein L